MTVAGRSRLGPAIAVGLGLLALIVATVVGWNASWLEALVTPPAIVRAFLVGIAVAAIVISALVASSLFRNVALALAAGAVVLLYLQGGTAALIAISSLVETEIKATPDFSQGLVVGLAISAVFLVGMRQRSS